MTSALKAIHPSDLARPWPRGLSRVLATLVLSVTAGTIVGYFVANGRWYLVVAALVVLPGFILAHRAPLAGIVLWILIAPLLLWLEGPAKYAYWAIHRAMPLAILVVIVLSRMLGVRTRPLARLGLPELMMLAYVVLSLISIAYSSPDPGLATIDLFDRVVVPMLLYLIVRLLRPDARALERFVPVVAVLIVTQAIIGALSWFAPGTLPSEWLGRAGSRTTGSLGSPSVYGVTMAAGAVVMIHAAAATRRPMLKSVLRALFALAFVMLVVSFTRAVWLGGLVVLVAVISVHSRQLRTVSILAVPVVILWIGSGAAASVIDTIENRLDSNESALSRLPVAFASLEMFEQKPLSGWGFGNFETYDREFQRDVGGFFPEKDHSSHNLYLRQLAEQGIVAAAAYLGPMVYWLIRSRREYARLPRGGLMGRGLLILLWSVLAAHVVVNNFSDMTVGFGLAQWWLILGLIGVIVSAPEAGSGAPNSPTQPARVTP